VNDSTCRRSRAFVLLFGQSRIMWALCWASHVLFLVVYRSCRASNHVPDKSLLLPLNLHEFVSAPVEHVGGSLISCCILSPQFLLRVMISRCRDGRLHNQRFTSHQSGIAKTHPTRSHHGGLESQAGRF
jgi:hypothetical protein